MSDEEKKPYIDQAKDKERADKERAAYDVSPASDSNSSLCLHTNRKTNKRRRVEGTMVMTRSECAEVLYLLQPQMFTFIDVLCAACFLKQG